MMRHCTAWRKNPERLREAAEALNDPRVRAMLSVIELDHPYKNPAPTKDGFEATKQLGIIEGYELALSTLRSLKDQLPIEQVPVQTTWGIPTPPPNPPAKKRK